MEVSKTKYHPMLYSTPMVQALLDYRKNKTRRTKGLEKVNIFPHVWSFEGFGKNPDNENDIKTYAYFKIIDTDTWMHLKCDYNIGDVLWVRENFHYIHDSDTNEFLRYGYQADNDYKGAKWKPSIHMPKVACRIFLKIKSIKIERLQEISEEDAIAEGAIHYESDTDWLSASYGFKMIWEAINSKESWNKNPFVFVYEFEQIEKPLDFC